MKLCWAWCYQRQPINGQYLKQNWSPPIINHHVCMINATNDQCHHFQAMCFEGIEKCLSGLDCIDLAWIMNMMIFFFLNHQNLNVTNDEYYLVCPLSGDTIKMPNRATQSQLMVHAMWRATRHDMSLGNFWSIFWTQSRIYIQYVAYILTINYISVIKWHNPWVCPYMLPRCLLWALKWISIHCSLISALSTRLVSALSSDDRTPCSPWEIMLVWV